ncbi:hypothetical protein [Streptomyces lasiicapitis]|uniref:DNA primase/polymerase bifunctional N-terminal domain-containing protein n=1 Tax=Streptomyces lasiicapitis TaxID=1923961 RepID=A0ABQ2LSH1_9ACTN|nr:hypothetical protein [Streptomyces lasiicapitis]GGO42779.1 hypothetical protein GCM10012286_25050 [Streptomyces lasiicapitis]
MTRIPPPSGPPTTVPQRDKHQISAWLAGADPHPRTVHAAWADRGIALLPLGHRFDAVRVPAARVHAAVHSDDPRTVAAFLRDWLAGPVIRDTRGPYYVLIAPDSPWNGREERLTTGTFLGVPRLGHPVSTLTRWVVPPTAPGDLCDPAHLGALLLTAETLEVVEP